MLSALTNCGPLARPRLVRDNDDGKEKDSAGGPAGGGLLPQNGCRAGSRRIGWLFWGAVLAPALIGIAVA